MFKFFFREQPAKKLAKINEPYFSLLKKEILCLEKHYFPKGKNCKRLHGKEKDFYRLRIGSYRIVYDVNHKEKVVTILRLFHRGEGY